MKKRYQIEGISCGGCIARVKKALEAHEKIEEVNIFLKPLGAANIRMEEKLSVEELQQQLDHLDGYRIVESI